MKPFCVLAILLIGSTAVAQQPTLNNDYGLLYALNDSLQYETYPLAKGWGYRLYVRYRLVVNQNVVPALPGNKPFVTEPQARRVAKLASQKIAKGLLPPTLSATEVKKALR
jgi:Domain of unknown function (DUF4907)